MRGAIASAVVLASIGLPRTARGVILTQIDSNVDAYFGAQSDAYHATDPTPLPAWGVAGTGPYGGTAIPNVPPQPPSLPGPPPPYPGGLHAPFSPAVSNSAFNDGFGNIANSSIVGGLVGSGATTNNATLAANMFLLQATGTGYAYEQIDFSIDYQVTPGALTGQSLFTQTFNVFGNIGSGGFAEFGGQLNFWDWNGSTATAVGSPLNFYYLQVGAGPFATSVSASALEGPVLGPDIYWITGDLYVDGDPSSINVQSVPEPASCMLLGIGLAGLAFARRFRILAAAAAGRLQ